MTDGSAESPESAVLRREDGMAHPHSATIPRPPEDSGLRTRLMDTCPTCSGKIPPDQEGIFFREAA